MSLSQTVTSDLDRYLRRFKRPEEYRPKVIKIIEMSKEGRTLEEIRYTVKMSNGNINSARKWGRQAGLW
jgi:hypothetical protein